MLLIGVKGHAGMSPRRNFGRGWGKLKSSPYKKNVGKKASTLRKKVAERPLNGEKGPPKGEKRSKRAFK